MQIFYRSLYWKLYSRRYQINEENASKMTVILNQNYRYSK